MMQQRPGVYIEQGPQNFEIIQRNSKDCADISLSGYWVGVEHADLQEVYVRILRENSNMEIVTFTKCDMKDFEWSVVLHNIPSGGPYKIETGLRIDNNLRMDWNIAGEMRHFVGVGDVYVIAGQSNSAGYGKGIVEDIPVIGVHALQYNGCWSIATHPLSDCTNAVYQTSLEQTNHGNSPYLSFAKILNKELSIPIGLVPTALGGSPISSWNPGQNGVLYRNMQKITSQLSNEYCGVLWYQGCAETDCPDEAESYEEHFKQMVSAWRKESNCSELLFLTFQLNRCRVHTDYENDRRWGMIREAQRQSARHIKNCYVVPTIDIPMSDAIHNSAAGNLLLGERMARFALSEVYHIGTTFTSASLKRAFVKGSTTIGLEFTGLVGILEGFTDDMKKLDITIEDENGKNDIKSCYFGADEIFIVLGRNIKGHCTISCGDKKDVEKIVPVDTGTFMPILCFAEVKVDE